MTLLRPALESDFAFCESLTHSNMACYLEARNIAWDPERYLASWREFENYVICVDGASVGVLRILRLDSALEIRDLQLLPTHTGQGIGTWAIGEAKAIAARRNIGRLQLRVYVDNPAQRLYHRLGFRTVETIDGVIHMACDLRLKSHGQD
jgi:GNAT superfamily N-acetyltransferase